MKTYQRYEAMKGEDGYWYVIHFELSFLNTGSAIAQQVRYNPVSGKMTRKEAEGTTNKRNGQ